MTIDRSDLLNNLLRTYQEGESYRIEVNPVKDEIPSFDLYLTSGHTKYSIEKMEPIEGYEDLKMPLGVFLFLQNCLEYIKEEWNKKRPKMVMGLKQKKYWIHTYPGFITRISKMKITQGEYFEIYYSYNQDSQIFSIKCLFGINEKASGYFTKYVYKTIVKLENTYGLMDKKVLKQIMSQAKQKLIFNFMLSFRQGENKKNDTTRFATLLKIRPKLYGQEDFDMDTITIILNQNNFSFGTSLTLRLKSPKKIHQHLP